MTPQTRTPEKTRKGIGCGGADTENKTPRVSGQMMPREGWEAARLPLEAHSMDHPEGWTTSKPPAQKANPLGTPPA